jgi:cell division septation protein DedD
MQTTSVRQLDEIIEADPSTGRSSRLGALVLASLGGAGIVFAAVLLLRSPAKPKPLDADPLGDLVLRAHPAGAKAPVPEAVVGREVTFPALLSDSKSPTTALEAVRGAKGANIAAVAEGDAAPTEPPPALDQLPVFPLPARHVLEASTAESVPQDKLTSMARVVAREDGAETAPVGGPGQFQLQVSSFKTPAEAQAFAAALRRRGHKAYVEPAYVKGRGLWHRVRIGPFKYRRSAGIYRQDFEAKERIVTFIVDPPKTTVQIRDALPTDDE